MSVRRMKASETTHFGIECAMLRHSASSRPIQCCRQQFFGRNRGEINSVEQMFRNGQNGKQTTLLFAETLVIGCPDVGLCALFGVVGAIASTVHSITPSVVESAGNII